MWDPRYHASPKPEFGGNEESVVDPDEPDEANESWVDDNESTGKADSDESVVEITASRSKALAIEALPVLGRWHTHFLLAEYLTLSVPQASENCHRISLDSDLC